MSTTKLGRNDLCPNCGKKVKRCDCGKGVKKLGVYRIPAWLFYGTIILICAIGGSWWGIERVKTKSQPKESWNEYFRQRPMDTWWLTHRPQDNQPAELAAITGKLQAKKADLNRLLTKYAEIGPLTKQIRAAFPKLQPSIFISKGDAGISMMLENDPKAPFGGLEVCFIPANEVAGGRARHPSSAYYKRGWGALMLYGVDLPEPLLASVVLHELTHALHHRMKMKSANAPENSDSFIEEEVWAHGVGSAVIDRATDGRFLKVVNEFLERHPRASYQEATAAIQPGDLRALETGLGWGPFSVTTAALIHGDFKYAVGWQAIRRAHPKASEQELVAEGVKMYRLIRQQARGE